MKKVILSLSVLAFFAFSTTNCSKDEDTDPKKETPAETDPKADVLKSMEGEWESDQFDFCDYGGYYTFEETVLKAYCNDDKGVLDPNAFEIPASVSDDGENYSITFFGETSTWKIVEVTNTTMKMNIKGTDVTFTKKQ